ncbi:hypothetical protein C8R43DRAFT_1128685 [Mycena crocata]|nr:hypothetical protein C8R43DRAFT_1128685 [Mycena crocata]
MRACARLITVPVYFPPGELTSNDVADLCKSLEAACSKWLAQEIAALDKRLPLIQGRLEHNEGGDFYLRVPVPAHRKALTRLYLSSHTLGIEILRYGERYREHTPRAFRFCRFCLAKVESESHALLGCTSKAELLHLRHDFLVDVYHLVPEFPRLWNSVDAMMLALAQCRNFDVIQRPAKYTFDVFAIYSTCNVFKPAEYLYNLLE